MGSVEHTERHLPDACIRQIASLVGNSASGGNGIVNLVSMCGVCRSWRAAARHLIPGTSICFDSLEHNFPAQPTLGRFRKLSIEQKRMFFRRAARLLTGYTKVIFAGDATSDALLCEVANSNRAILKSVIIMSTPHVTDAGVTTLAAVSPSLTELHLENLSSGILGTCLQVALQVCPRLESLHLANVMGMAYHSLHLCASSLTRLHLKRLHVYSLDIDSDLELMLTKLPDLEELKVDGPPDTLAAAAQHCPRIRRISYHVSSSKDLESALVPLSTFPPNLSQLELVVSKFTLTPQQLEALGRIPLEELRLDSLLYRQQPTLTRPTFSHLDNEGVRALVDSICKRTAGSRLAAPLRLSLCGATLLSHESVSALLRLPILTDLDLAGCTKVASMDKMRLVAKVRAGREMLEGRSSSSSSSSGSSGSSGSGCGVSSRHGHRRML